MTLYTLYFALPLNSRGRPQAPAVECYDTWDDAVAEGAGHGADGYRLMYCHEWDGSVGDDGRPLIRQVPREDIMAADERAWAIARAEERHEARLANWHDGRVL